MSKRAPRPLFLLASLALLAFAACDDNLSDITYPPSPNIKWWDGFDRQGMDDHVYALAEYEGGLVAGGLFRYAGGIVSNGVARWDGAGWTALGGGMLRDECASATCRAWVQSLVVFEGDLIAGGRFQQAGATRASCVARWNGTDWQSLGEGLEGTVFALAVYQGRLVAGGNFAVSDAHPFPHSLMVWDGIDWQLLGEGVDGPVQALTVGDGRLYVGGAFTAVGAGIAASHVAVWDGVRWSPLGLGLNDDVVAFTWYQSVLVAGGSFTRSGPPDSERVYGIGVWNGSVWRDLGGFYPPGIATLAVYHGDLVAGGSPDSREVPHIARWDGSTWTSLGAGLDRTVAALLVTDDHLYIGGWFRNAGNKLSRYIARWDD